MSVVLYSDGHARVTLADNEMVWVGVRWLVESDSGHSTSPEYNHQLFVPGDEHSWEFYQEGCTWVTDWEFSGTTRIVQGSAQKKVEVVKDRNLATVSVSVADVTAEDIKIYTGGEFSRAETEFFTDSGISAGWYSGIAGKGYLCNADSAEAYGAIDCKKWFFCFYECGDESGSTQRQCESYRNPRPGIEVYLQESYGRFRVVVDPYAFSPISTTYEYHYDLFPVSFLVQAGSENGWIGNVSLSECDDILTKCLYGTCEGGYNDRGYYLAGTDVILTAEIIDGCYEFDHWDFYSDIPGYYGTPGDLSANPASIRIPTGYCSSLNIWPQTGFYFTARYKKKTFGAEASARDGGSAEVQYGGETSTYLDVECGSSVSFNATPDKCYRFVKWLIDGTEYTESMVVITITKHTTAVAFFRKRRKKTEGDHLNFDPESGNIIYGCNGFPIFGSCRFLTDEEELQQ